MLFIKSKTNYIGLASEYDIRWLRFEVCYICPVYRISMEKLWFQDIASSHFSNWTFTFPREWWLLPPIQVSCLIWLTRMHSQAGVPIANRQRLLFSAKLTTIKTWGLRLIRGPCTHNSFNVSWLSYQAGTRLKYY